MKKVCLAFLMTCVSLEASHAMDREYQRAKSMLETMCGDVTLWAQRGRARTRTRRHFEPSERTSFTTVISDSDCRTA